MEGLTNEELVEERLAKKGVEKKLKRCIILIHTTSLLI